MPNFPMFERHLEMQSLKSERKIIYVENINVGQASSLESDRWGTAHNAKGIMVLIDMVI